LGKPEVEVKAVLGPVQMRESFLVLDPLLSRTLSQCLLDMFCGAFIVSAQYMSVDIHCHRCVSVPQSLRYGLSQSSRAQQFGSIRVAQVVKSNVFGTDSPCKRDVRISETVGRPRCAIRQRNNKIVVRIVRPEQLFDPLLAFPVFSKCIDERSRQCDGPAR